MARDIEVGELAPSFSLSRDGGSTVSSKAFKGRKLVIFFYPKADTPGCTREAMDFSRLRSKFAKAETEIVGVSADPVDRQDRFKAKHKLEVALASDPAHDMLTAYGAWGKKTLYGRTFMGVIRRTVLIGKNGRIAQIWPKVSVEGHAEDVLKAAKAL